MEAKSTVETRFDESMIVQEIHGASIGESLVKSVIRLKEDGARKALAELGYMGPAEAKALRARVAELEARAVVVPAWDVNAFALACVKEGAYAEGDLRNAIKNAEMGYNFAVSRAYTIPADRVLGDGEVKMEVCERDCREDDDEALEILRVCGYGQQAEMLEVAIKAHDLRANQGGADHD